MLSVSISTLPRSSACWTGTPLSNQHRTEIPVRVSGFRHAHSCISVALSFVNTRTHLFFGKAIQALSEMVKHWSLYGAAITTAHIPLAYLVALFQANKESTKCCPLFDPYKIKQMSIHHFCVFLLVPPAGRWFQGRCHAERYLC